MIIVLILLITKLVKKSKGDRYRSNFLNNLALGNNKDNNWLSTDLEYVKKYKWLLPFLTSTMKRISLNRFIKHAKACLTCNTYERLQEIKCPVYVIGGKKDQVVTYEGTNEISDLLQCESYYYAQYGHSLYEEAKDYHKRVGGSRNER